MVTWTGTVFVENQNRGIKCACDGLSSNFENAWENIDNKDDTVWKVETQLKEACYKPGHV